MGGVSDGVFGCCDRYEQEDMLPEHQRRRSDSEPFLQQEQRVINHGVGLHV